MLQFQPKIACQNLRTTYIAQSFAAGNVMHAGVTNRLPEPLASVLKCATLRAQENERCSVTDEMANVFLRSVEFATVSLGKKVLARPADFFGIAMFANNRVHVRR